MMHGQHNINLSDCYSLRKKCVMEVVTCMASQTVDSVSGKTTMAFFFLFLLLFFISLWGRRNPAERTTVGTPRQSGVRDLY
jgi:hypothetical protein